MLIEIDNDEVLEMLVDRVRFWTDDCDVISLYEQMYESYVDSGVYDGSTFNVMTIVDNDYVNWCNIYSEGDTEFGELLQIYKEQGLGDCSCECDFASYIEAVDNNKEPTMFLVRC